jgi:hypothetical protein
MMYILLQTTKEETMRSNMRSGAAAVVLACVMAACTSPAPAGGAAGAPARTASIEDSCINPTEITRQTIVSDQEIQFELRNRETWVNKLPRACHGLKLSGGFSWDVRGTLVCSNQERITVKDTGTPCQIGEFARLPAAGSPG